MNNEHLSTVKGIPKYAMILPDTRPLVRRVTADEISQLSDSTPILVDAAFGAQEGAQECTSGLDRSLALVVRLLPFSAVWLVLAVGICWKFDRQSQDALLIFGMLTAVTYYFMDKNERHDSRAGIEHHRINSATYLAERKMDGDAALRKQLVSAYLRQLEGPKHE